jgi:hypothetical protein
MPRTWLVRGLGGLPVLMCAFLAGGGLVYWECSYRAAQGRFPLCAASLLGVLIIGTWIGPFRFGGRSTNQWLWTLVPYGIVLALDWRADSIAVRTAPLVTPQLIREYVIRSSEFVLFAFAWVVSRPDMKPLVLASRRAYLSWRLGLILAALSMVGFEAYRVLQSASLDISNLDRFHDTQGQLIAVGCSIYVLALLRMFLTVWTEGESEKVKVGGSVLYKAGL